jgi:hypothetical protein
VGAARGAGWPEKFDHWVTRKEPDEKGEQRGYCPLCEDPGKSKSPSASFNFSRGSFKCFSTCQFGGSLTSLWARMQEQSMAEQTAQQEAKASVRSIKEAKSARGEQAPLPTEEKLAEWHDVLMRSEAPLRVMREGRGLSDETLAKFQIGYDVKASRYTIPVRDSDGILVNVRRYRPGEEGAGKVIGVDGRNEATIYGLPEIKNEQTVFIAEGEMDRLISQQHGFPTCTSTGGAGTWPRRFNAFFADKTVYICYDVDDGGKAGAQKVAASLATVAEAIYIVKLPLLQAKSDLTDYYVKQGYSSEDFQELCDRTPAYWQRFEKANKEPTKRVGFEESLSSEHARRPIEFEGMIAGKVQPPYLLPHKLEFICSQDFNTNKCAVCPMGPARGGQWETEIEPDDPSLLKMVDVNERDKNKVLNNIAGAPGNCNRITHVAKSEWNVEELVVVPSIEDRDASGNLVRRIFNVGSYDTPVNIPARVLGVNLPDPKTGRTAFLGWECEPTEADIDKFEVTDEVVKRLEMFCPSKGQSPIQKCQEIARDMSANVTRIYGRTLMHIAYDLVWHSVLGFKLNGVSVDKGWLELLVIGDTRTGKSEVALRLTDHYRSGILRSCEGATLAGLVGGAQQLGSQWMVTWGAIPLNDRRLVVLDEASGLKDKDIIEQMSAIRSSGKAQITKIVSQETNARTRLIWISNPADGRPMNEHARGGVEAIRSLVKNPEDIARFDLAMAAASADVPSSAINRQDHEVVPHIYTSEACAELIHWVWSRKPEDIVWDKGAEQAILDAAEEVGRKYVADPPLIQAENVRVKLARIAVAIAARTFSSDETGQKVVVCAEHVADAVRFIDTVYGMDSFGYKRHSDTTLRHRAQGLENIDWTRNYLKENYESVLIALQSCLGGPFKVRDFCEFAGMDQYAAQTATRELISHRMLRRLTKGNIVMEPALIQILKELEGLTEG